MIKPLLRRLKRLATRFIADRRQPNGQSKWENQWATPNFAPHWRLQTIPPELQETVDQQWFPPQSTLLDIGCGSGECANWLAQQGFQVLGIDFAPSAIARARRAYPENGHLQFQVLDICRSAPTGTFDVLFDRGCLHGVPHHLRGHYVQQVATVAAPGTRFLLLHKLIGDTKPSALSPTEETKCSQETFAQIQNEFQSQFEIMRMQRINFPCRSETHPSYNMPGLAIWMVRR